MSMIFACPSCGAESSLDVLVAHDEMRRLLAHMLATGVPLGALIARYLRLFKPAKQALRPDRLRKLLDALLTDMHRKSITRRGREWRIDSDTWKAGLEVVLEAHAKGTLDLPLSDHAYLYEVLMRIADKQEAVAERDAEAQRRSRGGAAEPEPIGPSVVAALVPSAVPYTPPSGPSPYARRLKAQIEARKQSASDDGGAA